MVVGRIIATVRTLSFEQFLWCLRPVIFLCALLSAPISASSPALAAVPVKQVLEFLHNDNAAGALELLNAEFANTSLSREEKVTLLWWTMKLRIASQSFDQEYFDQIDYGQRLLNEKYDKLLWTVIQASLSERGLAINDWKGAYATAHLCIEANLLPTGDTLQFVIPCLRSFLKSSVLIGKTQEAVVVVESYARVLIGFSILSRSNACDLLLLLGQTYTYYGDMRKARFAYGQVLQTWAKCGTGTTQETSAAVVQVAELLLENGNKKLVNVVLDDLNFEYYLKNNKVPENIQLQLKWLLLNLFAISGKYEKAKSLYTDDEIEVIERRTSEVGFQYPYRAVRAALLAYASLVVGHDEAFEIHLAELEALPEGLVDNNPAIHVLKTEAALRADNFGLAEERFRAFEMALMGSITKQIDSGVLQKFELRNYNKFLVQIAVNQFTKMPSPLKDGLALDSFFKLVQASLWPERRFGSERAFQDQISSGGVNPIVRHFLAVVRSNEKSKDVSNWQLLNKLVEFIGSGNNFIRQNSTEDLARASLRASDAVREFAVTKRETLEGTQRRKDPESVLKPLSVSSTQSLLKMDEALYAFVVLGDQVAAVCLHHNKAYFSQRHISAAEFDKSLRLVDAALRINIPVVSALDREFPIQESNRVYTVVFGEQVNCFRGKSHLFIVPPPELSLLPFNALVAKNPSNELAKVEWLADVVPFSVLTSVGSLMAVRANQRLQHAPKYSFLGVADPVFKSPKNKDSLDEIVIAQSLYPTRGIKSDAGIKALPNLPETKDEVMQIAELFAKDAVRIISGTGATEVGVRKVGLENFRIIDFASHALVAGEYEGVAEPAIVLTPGNPDLSRADGLLSASEVNELSLRAQLVILSACNTASGDSSFSSPGLSGLADSFLAAGANSVAVTQWAVNSEAAKLVSIEIVKGMVEREETPARSLASAIKIIREIQNGKYRHPRFWAGFILIGDGGSGPNLTAALDSRSDDQSARVGQLKFNLDYELLTEGDRIAEWSDLIDVPGGSGDVIVSGISAEISESHKNRAAGIIQRVDKDGNIIWRSVDADHVYSYMVLTDPRTLLVVTSTFSLERKSASHISKFDVETGALISAKLIVDTPALDNLGRPKLVNGELFLPYKAEDFSDPDQIVRIGMVRVDPKSIEVLDWHHFDFSKKELVGLDLKDVFYRSSGIPALISKGGKVKLVLPIEVLDLRSNENKKEFAHRQQCRNFPMTLFFELDGGLRYSGSSYQTKFMRAFEEAGLVAYQVIGPCSRRDGVRLSNDQHWRDLSMDPAPVVTLRWPTPVQIAQVKVIDNGYLISGNMKIRRPFMERPGELDVNRSFIDETWNDAYDPKGSFMALVGEDGEIKDAYIFQDDRTRFIQAMTFNSETKRFHVAGVAHGGDAWLFSGTLE